MINLKIIDPTNGISYDNEIFSIEIITTEGHITLQENIVPYILNLINARCYIKFKDKKTSVGVINGGVAYCDTVKGILILTNYFEWFKEENIEIVKTEILSLKKEIENTNPNSEIYNELEQKIYLKNQLLQAYQKK